MAPVRRRNSGGRRCPPPSAGGRESGGRKSHRRTVPQSSTALEMDIDASDVAAILVHYSIQDDLTKGSLPEGYEGRGAEHELSASCARSQLPEIMECAYGSRRPPATADD